MSRSPFSWVSSPDFFGTWRWGSPSSSSRLVVAVVVGRGRGSGSGIATTERYFSSSAADMASDEDYASFLDKANQDPSEGRSKVQSGGKVELKALDKAAEVPKVLRDVAGEAYYVSDADEPFHGVCLKYSGKTLPTEGSWSLLFPLSHLCPVPFDVVIFGWGDMLTDRLFYRGIRQTSPPPRSQESERRDNGYWGMGYTRTIQGCG